MGGVEVEAEGFPGQTKKGGLLVPAGDREKGKSECGVMERLSESKEEVTKQQQTMTKLNETIPNLALKLHKKKNGRGQYTGMHRHYGDPKLKELTSTARQTG